MARLKGDLARLDALLVQYEREIRDVFIAAILASRNSIDVAALEAALQAGDTRRAVELLTLRQGVLFPLDQSLVNAYVAGGQMIGAAAPAYVGIVGFDGRATRAEAWTRSHVGNLITEIVQDQLAMSRQVVEAQIIAGRNPRSAALDIAGRINKATGRREGGFIGLTSRQADYVAGARQQLVDLDAGYFDRALRDKRSDGLVRRAIREGKPLSTADIDRITGRYKDRMLRHRAEVIARTESITALRAGRREGILQAIEQGAIRQDRLARTWDATLDSRTRPDHVAMHGTKIDDTAQPYTLPDGSRMMYPGDVSLGASGAQTIQCRCFEAYRVDWLRP